MFLIKEVGRQPIKLSDVKDIYDNIIGITGDTNEAARAYSIICNMHWGDIYRTPLYSIECFDETKKEIVDDPFYSGVIG
ncbi:MAG: hypothetical protein IJT36_03210 [Alphaproteobacteria bacterium]|nr:hypothetical protein [Alphaproteobacteria bacterium]